MAPKPTAVLRQQSEVVLTGIMAVYSSQAEASAKIPDQWRAFLAMPIAAIQDATVVYGASPCTSDHRIHYLAGVEGLDHADGAELQQVVLPAGEYATFTVQEHAGRDQVWGWILQEWIASSDYQEASTPEFERFPKTRGSNVLGVPVELGIPIEAKQPR